MLSIANEEGQSIISVNLFSLHNIYHHHVVCYNLSLVSNNILGVEHNNFIKHGRLADDFAGTGSVPVRRIHQIKSHRGTQSEIISRQERSQNLNLNPTRVYWPSCLTLTMSKLNSYKNTTPPYLIINTDHLAVLF